MEYLLVFDINFRFFRGGKFDPSLLLSTPT